MWDVLWPWSEAEGGELSATILESTWAICLFVEAEAEIFFKETSTLLTVTPLAHLQTKLARLVLKNTFQVYPLLVRVKHIIPL